MFKLETNMSMRRGWVRRGWVRRGCVQHDGLRTAKHRGILSLAPLFVSSNADMIGVRSNLSRIKENESCG